MEKQLTSGEEMLSNLFTYSNAGAGIIHVRAKEVARAYKEVRDGIVSKGFECKTWNVVTGSHTMTTSDMETLAIREGDNNPDFQGHLINMFHSIDDDTATSHVYHLYVNADRWFEEPATEYTLQQLARDLPSTYHRIVFITADMPLPEMVSDLMISVSMSTPTYDEYMTSYTALVDSLPETYIKNLAITDDGVSRICKAGSGLTYEEFETYLSEAFVRSVSDIKDRDITYQDILSYLNKSKTYIVNKSDLLELYPAESINNVGGLENVKDWVHKRKDCYSEEAKELGVEPPKGILLTGVSGAGKSLIAKAIAGVLGAGLVKLDMGKMFNSFVGKSEERMRKALQLAEDLAPVVLLVDEIDKGMGGVNGGGGDSGTSKRVLGTFLSWMQDCTKPVFVVATANDVISLPPELTRKGRLDQIFFVGLPNTTEKSDILNIHLEKRGYGDVFTDDDIRQLVGHMDGFVGAEVEAVVKEAIINMFNDGEELQATHIMQASKAVIPLSKSHAKVVADIITWGSQNAVPASRADTKDTAPKRKRRTRNVSSIH